MLDLKGHSIRPRNMLPSGHLKKYRWPWQCPLRSCNRPFAQLWPGNEVRGIAGCVMCVSHWSFRFSSALECLSAITVVFLAFSIEAGLVLHSFLMVFHGQVSSGSAGYLPFVRLTGRTGRTSASPRTRSYALITSSLQKIFAFMLVPKSLWTLPSPVLWNRVRLDTSRKQVQCHRCFLFTRMGPKWKYETRRRLS